MLYEDFNALTKTLGPEFFRGRVPREIVDNLNPKLELRDYQREALGRLVFYTEEYQGREVPMELLFNMATGSGKTLVMAGAMLYLYTRGYRNFIFFTRLDGVVKKTIDNFTNPQSSKYLFAPQVQLGGRVVPVRVVDTFAGTPRDALNIKFQTIGGLHLDLHNPRENRLTFEELAREKIVLLGDEAHNFNADTKREKEQERSWEQTIERLHCGNAGKENVFLAFTATIDWPNDAIANKYRNKTLYRYDLAQFRADGFSKDIKVAGIDVGVWERAVGALLLSQYRRKVAERHGLFLKPVVMMKSRSIKESEEFVASFHEGLKNLKVKDITPLATRGGEALKQAFLYFKTHQIPLADIVAELKDDFAPAKCLSVHSKDDSEAKQLLVNSLEDVHNPIRLVFAVDKLNEGWDVLNLFDIVRLYETRQSSGRKLSPVTMAEAQLIGRGARYWPFTFTPMANDRYLRKYDADLGNELRALEELYYHTKYDSRYIAEIRSALVKTGALAPDEQVREYEVKVKESVKQSKWWREGVVYVNEKKHTGHRHIKSLADVPGLPEEYVYDLARGGGREVSAFGGDTGAGAVREVTTRVVEKVSRAVWQEALYRSRWGQFAVLASCFPHLKSLEEFIESPKYLGGVRLVVRGEQADVFNTTSEDIVRAAEAALRVIATQVTQHTGDYHGTKEFTPKPVSEMVRDKKIKVVVSEVGEQEFGVPMREARTSDLRLNLAEKDWYVYDEHYGTKEEKQFVHFIHSMMTDLEKRYAEVRLLRNERLFKLYRFADGAALEPDFVLFLREAKGKQATIYQLFVEPKGEQLIAKDQWKEDFLREVAGEYKVKTLFENATYKISGLPFYTHEQNERFRAEFDKFK